MVFKFFQSQKRDIYEANVSTKKHTQEENARVSEKEFRGRGEEGIGQPEEERAEKINRIADGSVFLR